MTKRHIYRGNFCNVFVAIAVMIMFGEYLNTAVLSLVFAVICASVAENAKSKTA